MEQDETCVPTFLEKRIDVKAMTLLSFQSAIEAKTESGESALGNPKPDLFIITNFGIITGEIQNLDDVESQEDVGAQIDNVIFKNRNNILAALEKDYGSDARVVNNSSIIVIKNATIIPFTLSQSRHNFNRLLLFTDQIVGISYGTLS
jgi:hypothetical protein